jgi:hypothetical protein
MNASDPQQGQSDLNEDLSAEAEVLAQTVAALRGLSKAGRERVLQTLNTFFGSPKTGAAHVNTPVAESGSSRHVASFSEDRTLAPKAFMLDKKPLTDLERVTCLAYYLTHYRDTPEFKTIDLSKLNTEAAQVKLSNPAMAVDNAVKAGLLVATSKGNKMIGANGELYVQALPDRDAARAAIAHARPRRKKRQRSSAGEAEENA